MLSGCLVTSAFFTRPGGSWTRSTPVAEPSSACWSRTRLATQRSAVDLRRAAKSNTHQSTSCCDHARAGVLPGTGGGSFYPTASQATSVEPRSRLAADAPKATHEPSEATHRPSSRPLREGHRRWRWPRGPCAFPGRTRPPRGDGWSRFFGRPHAASAVKKPSREGLPRTLGSCPHKRGDCVHCIACALPLPAAVAKKGTLLAVMAIAPANMSCTAASRPERSSRGASR